MSDEGLKGFAWRAAGARSGQNAKGTGVICVARRQVAVVLRAARLLCSPLLAACFRGCWTHSQVYVFVPFMLYV